MKNECLWRPYRNHIYKLDFYTQYSQFYICDSQSPLKTDSHEFWTDEAHDSRLAVEEGVLGVGTECYGPVRGELEILNEENSTVKTVLFDHIVEGGLEIKSGRLRILNCPSSSIELEIKLSDGIYRVRIYSSNLSSVDGDEGDDFYRIEIWKGTGPIITLLKSITANSTTMYLRIVLCLSVLITASCGLKDESCLNERLEGPMTLLKDSYLATLEHNSLKGNRGFLLRVIECTRGSSTNGNIIIPEDARISANSVSALDSVLRNREGTYSQANQFVTCIRESKFRGRSVIKKYIAMKDAVGNISPEIMAEGFYHNASEEDLLTDFFTEIIILEVYLPLMKRADSNAR